MCISVDLPEPDGPDDRDELAFLDAQRDVAQRGDLELAVRVDLADVDQLDDGGPRVVQRGDPLRCLDAHPAPVPFRFVPVPPVPRPGN